MSEAAAKKSRGTAPSRSPIPRPRAAHGHSTLFLSSSYVVSTRTGRPALRLAPAELFSRLLQSLFASAEQLPAIRLHDLRHTHATLLLADGVPVKVVSECFGHASATITLTVYQQVHPGMAARPPTASRRCSTAEPGRGVSRWYHEGLRGPTWKRPGLLICRNTGAMLGRLPLPVGHRTGRQAHETCLRQQPVEGRAGEPGQVRGVEGSHDAVVHARTEGRSTAASSVTGPGSP